MMYNFLGFAGSFSVFGVRVVSQLRREDTVDVLTRIVFMSISFRSIPISDNSPLLSNKILCQRLLGESRSFWCAGGEWIFDFPRRGMGFIISKMVLVIDNYDSFTYNLVQYLGELGVELQVRRNDEISLDAIRALKPERILVSPGPCSPREAGLSNEVIRTFASEGVPVFGVCLGHQCIGHTFGAEVVVNYRMMHGKTSLIKHNGKDLFEGMPNPFAATRYHSLVIKRDTLPDCLEITAETDEGEIMGVKHKTLPIWGVQFHPESILTESGRTILKNFLKLK